MCVHVCARGACVHVCLCVCACVCAVSVCVCVRARCVFGVRERDRERESVCENQRKSMGFVDVRMNIYAAYTTGAPM
jgi:hypothetical protein